MDVRQSLNIEDNLAVVTGDGQLSFIEGDSFYAKAPPLAASTVGRTKTRRMMKPEETEMGSFLDDTPVSAPKSNEDRNQKQLLFDFNSTGARPKTYNFDGGDQLFDVENGTDWSVVNDWCRENKQDTDMSDQDGKSSLGIIDIDRMDLSSNNLLLDSAMGNQGTRNTTRDSTLQDSQGTKQSSIKENVSRDTQLSQLEGSSSLKELGSSDSNSWKRDGSSTNNSHDSKPEQLFARSQLGTVKKAAKNPIKTDPAVAAMRQMLFGQSAIGEENECDESVYNVELAEEDLQELDADFDMSVAGESDSEKSPEKTPTNKTTSISRYGEDMPLDSLYLRPGVTGEETHPQLPYLSKVSLFDGGSGSEIDTEDELELVRKAQGERIEAAGEDSDGQRRPGLEGLSLTDETRRQLPITQRQSAEGNVVTSPVPGDGGGGGDGSSGPDSDDNVNLMSQNSSNATEQQEQRIRPMGDDLLSDLRFSRYATTSTGQSVEDLCLSSRYLTPGSAVDDSVQPSFNIDEFLASRNSPLDQDFDPGNRLEASGFNADDVSNVNNKASNPFDDVKSSSFGSFGLSGSGGQAIMGNDSRFSLELVETDPNDDLGIDDNDVLWIDLEGSIRTSEGSKTSSLDNQAGLGRRSAASGSPCSDQRMLTTGGSQTGSDRHSSGTQGRHSPWNISLPDSGQPLSDTGQPVQPVPDSGQPVQPVPDSGQPLSDSGIFRKPSMPAPKAAKFYQSQAKSKSSSSSSRSSTSNSGQSSNRSSLKSLSSEGIDLELRTSLSGKVKEQRDGLKRVPSCGGTSAMDLTVNDEDFFGFADAKAMIDADEVEFEEENVFRQDDPMAEQGSQNDSWAYRSIMTVARPSWLNDTSQEEQVCVRISVGTFMRGRTEALGTLDGDEDVPRPDFGMSVNSPPKVVRPSAEYSYNTPVCSKGDKEQDCTLTMDSLVETCKPELSISSLNIDDSNYKLPDKKSQGAKSPLISMGEISMLVNAADFSINAQSKRLHNLAASKYASKPGLSQNSSSSGTSSSISASNGSSRSFPKVADSNKSLLKCHSTTKDSAGDTEQKKNTFKEPTIDAEFANTVEKILEENNLNDTNTRESDPSEYPEDVWSSPNTSNCLPTKLDNFKFSVNNDIADEFRKKFKILSNASASGQGENLVYDDFAREDRERTPPPDGQSGSEKAKVSTVKGCAVQVNRKFSDNGQTVVNLSNSSNIGNQPDIIPGHSLSRTSPVHDKKLLENDNERSRLDTSAVDHGYMPGHHIPDGTEYSQRSDYAHINHKGELREDVAGMDDVGLAESRGFDILKQRSTSARNLDNRFLNNHENMAEFTADKNRNKLVVNVQPTQSRSPMMKPVAKVQNSVQKVHNNVADRRNQNDLDGDLNKSNEGLHNADTQTDENTRRLESWTQTSFVFNQDNEETEPIVSKSPDLTLGDDNHLHYDSRVNISGIPPKVPMSSFKHNLLPNNQSAVADKPHLLTKQSLMQTGFAQDNLRRDYSVEVMDRIYSRNSVGSHGNFHTMNATSMTTGEVNLISHRESLESQMTQHEWRAMQEEETLNATDFSRPSDIYGNGTAFMRLASAQSTPYPLDEPGFFSDRLGTRGSMFSQTSVNPSQGHKHKDEHLSKTGSLPDNNSVCATLCPVEAPGVLKFQEVCCVGISRKEVLPLYNPTDRWTECVFQVNTLEINGRAVPLDSFPFTIRQNKIIIHPRKTEYIDVMFLPKCAGAYIAHIQVFSKSFSKNQTAVIPVNVTIQAISEDPRIKVYEKDCEENVSEEGLDFGGVMWGTCREKTICIHNVGLASVPLRLALTSNAGWHCFLFEPEGRESNVSIVSGGSLPSSSSHGRNIINLCLTGSNQPFNYHEVKIWCKPPNKQCTKALCKQPPEELSCKMDIEVDIPSCRFPKLSSFHVRASIGFRKLHIQSNLKELRLTCAANQVVETHFKVFNAGNLPLDVEFAFHAHKQFFSVSPMSLRLMPPGVDCELSVAFKPKEDTMSRLASLLLMYVLPDKHMFELVIQGEVKEEIKQPIKLYCNQTLINFGGVALGKTCVKSFRLMNKNKQALNLCAMVRADNVLIARSPDPHTVGSKSLDVHVAGNEEDIVTVYVLYNPVTPSSATGKVVIKQVPATSSYKFSVQVDGYGGVSRLCCSSDMTCPTRAGDVPCIGIQSFSLGQVKEMFIHNLGERSAVVQVGVFRDVKCTEQMLSAKVVVQPSEFVIGVNVRQKLELVVSMTEREFTAHSDASGIGAVLCFSYKDQVNSVRPYRSQLVVGLVKGCRSDVVEYSPTSTPSVSSRHRKFVVPSSVADDNSSQYTPRSDSSNIQCDSLKPDNGDGWCIKPGDLTIYCSSKWPNNELDKFCIYNLTDTRKRFEIVWPGEMLSVTPANGTMSPRESTTIKVFPTIQASQVKSWTGEVIVSSNRVSKSLKVNILQDETVPQSHSNTAPQSLSHTVPQSLSHKVPQSLSQSAAPTTVSRPRSAAIGTGSSRLGNLQISRTVVKFDPTKVGKVSEETLELTNLSNQNLRWTFTSFASPYHLDKGDSSQAVTRKSYRVFEFSQQFGKLGHHGNVKITLKFMPQSPGTYSQYWDLKTLDYERTDVSSTEQDFVRLHLTGDCLESPEDKQARPALSDVENLLPRLGLTKLRLVQDVLKFPTIAPNEEHTLKTDVKNSHCVDVQVTVMPPQPPFYLKFTKPFTVAKKRFVRFPVEFRPTLPGNYSELLLFKSAKGESISLKLNGVCSLTSHK